MQIVLILLSILTLVAIVAMVVVLLRSRRMDDGEELLRLRTQVAELQRDLSLRLEENARIRQESSDMLQQVRAEADTRLKEAKEEAAITLQQTKEEAATVLQEAKDASERRVESVREEQKAHYEELSRQQKENAENSMKVLREHFVEAFQNLKKLTTDATDEMLRQRQSEFSEASQKSIDTILAPLRQQLDIMQKSMTDSRLSQTELKTAMHTEIENLMRQTALTAQSADELARALTHDAKYQGNWGERECEELLRHEGLRRGIEYETQVNIKYADNTGRQRDFRPDFILHLDSKRDVIIDAKVSLTAFKDYCNAQTDEERKACLKRHVQSVQDHVRELAEKDYAAYLKAGKTMNFVIMFVPITGALWTALQEQPDLWQRAMDRGVYIADEQTLFAALSIVKMTWTTFTQLERYQEVFKQAEVLVDRVGEFYERFKKVGAALDKAKESYNSCSDKLEDHGQSIIVAARNMNRLGVKMSGKHPLPATTDIDEIPALTETQVIMPSDDMAQTMDNSPLF